jgi:hypothetical protein
MTHRHYSFRVTKPRDAYTCPARAGAWSGTAFIGSIMVIMILLGVILFGVNKTATDAANNPASVPRTAGDEVASLFATSGMSAAISACRPTPSTYGNCNWQRLFSA